MEAPRGMGQRVTEQISAGDWEATPAPVRSVLLALERERDAFRSQIGQVTAAREAASAAHKSRLERYHALVEQQFLAGLTPEHEQEIERLGREIDELNSAFYPSLSSLAETIASLTGITPK